MLLATIELKDLELFSIHHFIYHEKMIFSVIETLSVQYLHFHLFSGDVQPNEAFNSLLCNCILNLLSGQSCFFFQAEWDILNAYPMPLPSVPWLTNRRAHVTSILHFA